MNNHGRRVNSGRNECSVPEKEGGVEDLQVKDRRDMRDDSQLHLFTVLLLCGLHGRVCTRRASASNLKGLSIILTWSYIIARCHVLKKNKD
jgi:hypothetical protein